MVGSGSDQKIPSPDSTKRTESGMPESKESNNWDFPIFSP